MVCDALFTIRCVCASSLVLTTLDFVSTQAMQKSAQEHRGIRVCARERNRKKSAKVSAFFDCVE